MDDLAPQPAATATALPARFYVEPAMAAMALLVRKCSARSVVHG